MRLPKRGEKGFTLIELLIVVAILGVLAAVVIPNVSKFIGRGKTEAAATELANIQSATISMMTDNSKPIFEAGEYATTATSDMSKFPDPGGVYVLYHYSGNATINYVVSQNTTESYTCDAMGTVTQH